MKERERRDGQRQQLNNAIQMRSAQDAVLWTIFGAFWGSNAILLVALFSDGHWPSDPLIGALIAGVGAALSRVWGLIQARAVVHIEHHERVMRHLEKELNIQPEAAVAGPIMGGTPARDLMRMCSFVAAYVWIGTASIFLFAVIAYRIFSLILDVRYCSG